MRTELANHVGEFVHGAGWFRDLKKVEDKDFVRITISQPTLKKPDRNLLWKDLETISTEDHLNMFYPIEDWNSCQRKISLYDKSCFYGEIYGYTRKDGSKDFGIKTVPIPDLFCGLKPLIKEITIFFDHTQIWDQDALQKMEQDFLPRIIRAEEVLESSGDRLITTHHTYKEISNELQTRKKELEIAITDLSCLLTQRHHKRLLKRQTLKAKGKKQRPLFMQFAN